MLTGKAPNLRKLCGSERRKRLATLESFFENRQYDSLSYDWDGALAEGHIEVAQGQYIPMRMRRPSMRVQVPKLIVKRYTDFIFGEEKFPAITVPGDEDSEEFIKEAAKVARLKV